MPGTFAHTVASLLPPSLRLRLKRIYYPWLIRRFDADRWPGGRFVEALVAPGDHVVDAGANIGYVTALLARWVGPCGRVDAIEPVPATFDLLSRNVRALKLNQVRCHGVGIAAHNSEAWMEVPRFPDGRENFYESRVVERGPAGPNKAGLVSVQLRRLDTLLADRDQPVRFMKIDVEGHELPAVEGGWELLKSDRPALLIEVSGDPDDAASAAGRLVARLAELGYSPWLLSGDTLRARRSGDRAVDYFFLTPPQAERVHAATL
jgi:FkbM family methyltransferase